MALQYLLAPTFQFVNTAGKPLSGGAYMEVYVHGTRTKYFCASDFNGTLHPFRIPLDSLGSNIVLANDTGSYDVYAYNRYGTLMMSRYNVKPGAGGGIGGTITSTDGSIDIHPTEDGVDLSVNGLDPSCLKVSADPRTTDGKFYFDTLVKEGDQAYVDNEGAIRLIKGWYHFTANVQLAWNAGARNETHQVTLYTTLSNSVIDFDISHVHTETIELSGDVSIAQDGSELVIGVSGMPVGLEASVISMDVHAITGKDGHDKYYAGNGITISNENYVAVDFDEVQEKLVAGSGVTIEGNVISAPTLVQAQADWTEEDTESRAYIKHKPDLDVFATKTEVNTGLAGKQNTIPDLAAIRSGAQAGASAVQPADLAAVATTGSYNDLNHRPNLDQYATDQELTSGLATKQDTISDLATIRSGAAAGATAVQPAELATVATTGDYDDLTDKPDLSVYATTQAMNTALAGKQDTINDLSTIRSGAAAGATALQPSDVATVATTGDYDDLTNKPSIPTSTSDLTNDSGFITSADVPVKDVQVDGASVVNAQGTAEIDLSGYATTQALTTALASKQDTISDLATIRSGAAAGATAVQPADMSAALADKENSSNKSQTIDPSSTTEFPSSAATANFVNSSVATSTANFLGNFTLTDLGLTYPATDAQIGAALDAHVWPAGVTPTNNDYTYIEIQDPQTTSIDDRVERFKFNGTNWVYEYTLNNSSFTAAEKAAIDSGIDSAKVAVYDAHVANSDIHVTTSDKSTWNAKQDAISDLATIRSGAAAGASAVQPGDLAVVATTGSYDSLSNKPTIPTVDQSYSSSSTNAQSGVAVAQAISAVNQVPSSTSADADKVLTVDAQGTPAWASAQAPISAGTGIDITNNVVSVDTSVVATQTDLAGKQDTISDLATIRSGAAEGATAVQPGDLATVATTGSYDDLVDKPTIPAAQVNSDWNSNSGVSQILNKPTLATVATTGDYDDLANKPSIPAAQVNSDWNAVSGVSEILNKPTIPSGTQLVPAATIADADKVLTVNAQGTPEWATGGGSQVQSDWTESDRSAPSYIENKPVPKTLTAGTGISITENASTITIANTAPDLPIGSWEDVSTEAQYNTTPVLAGGFAIKYNAMLKLVSVTADVNLDAGAANIFTWSNRLKPVANAFALGNGLTLYVSQTTLNQPASATNRWVNGVWMWPVVGE